jgi:hypothetical protein
MTVEVWEVGFYAGSDSRWVPVAEGTHDYCRGFLEGLEYGDVPKDYYKIRRKP